MSEQLQANGDLLNLQGKRAVVTGGAVGIGQGIVARLAAAEAQVLIADISEENLAQAREAFAQTAYHLAYTRVDVSNPDDVERMCAEATATLGGIDILVNNAGVYPNILLMNMTVEDFNRVISVNLVGTFLTTQAAAKVMIGQGQGGRIINVTSIDALHPSMAGLAHYDASKHGVWGFTKNVALELAQHNIWVNAVAPGGISTPGVAALQQSAPSAPGVDMSKMLEQFLQSIPMRRMGVADDIGKAVLFLASDMSSYMTGSQMVVDGGALLS